MGYGSAATDTTAQVMAPFSLAQHAPSLAQAGSLATRGAVVMSAAGCVTSILF
jgi:hypothetical protein